MEPNELFATCILIICVIHLAAAVNFRLESWWEKTIGKNKTAVATGRQRSDWYAFFHCADLVGKELPPKNGTPGVGSITGAVGKRVAPTGRRADTRLRLS